MNKKTKLYIYSFKNKTKQNEADQFTNEDNRDFRARNFL